MGTALAIGGLVAGAGSIVAGAQGGRGPRAKDLIDGSFFRGTQEGGLVPGMIELEIALALGASPEAIAEDFLFRQAFATGSAGLARNLQQHIANARNALAQGDTQRAASFVASANNALSGGRGGSRSVGGSGRFILSADGKSVVAEVDDPEINAILSAAREESDTIRSARTAGIRRLATGADIGAREQEASEFLRIQLQDAFDRATAQEDERSNRLGLAPRTEGINREFLNLQNQIGAGGALERALALIQGEQTAIGGALTPSLLNPFLQQQQISTDALNATSGQALQLANARADAEQARAAGIASGLDSFGSILSSDSLAGALGGGKKKP